MNIFESLVVDERQFEPGSKPAIKYEILKPRPPKRKSNDMKRPQNVKENMINRRRYHHHHRRH